MPMREKSMPEESMPEKDVPEKYVTTIRNGQPIVEYNPEYKAHRRHITRWPDRITSALVGLAGAAVIGTVAAAASYVLPLVPVATHAGMAALSAIAASTGVLAAAGVAAIGVVASLAVVGVAGFLALAGAVRLYDEYKIAMENDFRPASALAAGGVTLAAALAMAVTAAPERPQEGLSKTAAVATAFDTAARANADVSVLAVQKGQEQTNASPPRRR